MAELLGLKDNLSLKAQSLAGLQQQFWQTEELPLIRISISEEEEFCENHFKATYKINNESRFACLFIDINQLGNTRGLAVSRLLAMENKFKSDAGLEWEYKSFMEEYEKLGHMSPNKELDGKIFSSS
ncbi:uncharacterized protein TNIN_68821 [Trichonephila inaurata madagascariensis]|uniref:Uncharacterized protein n=1 Tax=Trichonephila inaurata madagascariensis TaxID=2747483 RepID=A0A8X6Y904_9ARAC|nr:uncharacterized protein TNIN_68821 [Trichonephila inaurata madagascariensis]